MRIIFWFGVLLCVTMAFAVRMTEVLYDPIGDENSQEFVEIYSPDNLSGYLFGDRSRNQTLQLSQWTDNPYALIVTTLYNKTRQNTTFYTTGSQLGNGLSNTGDAVFLYLNNTLLDSMEYNKSAVPEGYSLEQAEDRWRSSTLLGGSPGRMFAINTPNLPIENRSDHNRTLESFSSSNFTMQIWTDKLIYKPGEKMQLALEWSEPGKKAQIDIRDLQGDLLHSYPSTRMIRYTITKNTSALWIQAYNRENNVTDQKIIGILLPTQKTTVAKEENCPRIKLPKEPVRIVAFYTRAQRYQETIKLYVHLEGEGNYTITLESPLETKLQNITLSNDYEGAFEVKPLPSKNLFTLQVWGATQKLATEVLTFQLEPVNQTKVYSTHVSLEEKPLPPKATFNTSSISHIETPSTPRYVGTITYNSNMTTYLTYGLVALLALTLFLLIKGTKKDIPSEKEGAP